MTCTHHWTTTSECPKCLRSKVAKLREALEAMLTDLTPIDGYPSPAAVDMAVKALEDTE